jgi:hypothetical protein
MLPIMFTAKLLLLQELVVWLPWMQKDIWQAKSNFSLLKFQQKNPSK